MTTKEKFDKILTEKLKNGKKVTYLVIGLIYWDWQFLKPIKK